MILGIVARRTGAPKPSFKSSVLGFFVKNVTRFEITDKRKIFHIAHRRTTLTHSWHQVYAQQLHVYQNTSVYKHLAYIVVRSAEELFAIEKHGRPRPWQQEDHGGVWSAVVDNEALVTEAALGGEMVPRNMMCESRYLLHVSICA